MYALLLTLHALLRWVVVIVGILAVGRALLGWRGAWRWTPLDARLSMIYPIVVDIQVLLGLILYFFLSPELAGVGGTPLGDVLADGRQFYWTFAHTFVMIVALALIHIGRVRMKRADDDAGRFRQTAIFYGLGTLAILLLIPWPFMTPYGRPLLPSPWT
ncbi:MAG: hypothetical protein M5R40_00840 [Anaerolineae bacterium]|nr:hypothetical protein [Anaerolineae bacterium]